MKNSLRARCAGPDWFAHLPWVLLGIRTSPRSGSASSASEALLGVPLTVPGEFVLTPEVSPDLFLRRLHLAGQMLPLPTQHHAVSPSHMPTELQDCPCVFVRRDAVAPPLTPLYTGPFRVHQRAEKYFLFQLGPHEYLVSLDRLRPAHCAPDVQPAEVPRRGRPPKKPLPSVDVSLSALVRALGGGGSRSPRLSFLSL